MRITPLDVRKQEFRKVVRGLDGDEVSAFLATVADEYEAVLVDNKQLRGRMLELDEKVAEYRTMEKTLRDTLMAAERVLNETKENAAKEAELVLRDAEMRAQQLAESYRREATEQRREIIALHKEKEAYLARFRGLAEAQIQFIDHHQTDFEDLDRRLMALVQSPDPERELRSMAPAASASRTVAAAPPPAAPPPLATQPAAPATSTTERDEWRNYTPGRTQSPQHSAPVSPLPVNGAKPRETGLEKVKAHQAVSDSQPSAEGAGPSAAPAAEIKADSQVTPAVDRQEELVLGSKEVDQLLEPIQKAQTEHAQSGVRPPDEEKAKEKAETKESVSSTVPSKDRSDTAAAKDANRVATDESATEQGENESPDDQKKQKRWDIENFTKTLGGV